MMLLLLLPLLQQPELMPMQGLWTLLLPPL
jgi:hypothetical protein